MTDKHIHYYHELDNFLGRDDPDRKALETCLSGFKRDSSKCDCKGSIFILEILCLYFIDNLRIRNIDLRVPEYYEHILNNIKIAHCFYNPKIKDCNYLTSLPLPQFQEGKEHF